MKVSEIDCPDCQGEGYVICFQLRFSVSSETFEPSEHYQICKSCFGEGSTEVCSFCKSGFQIKEGLEVCQCKATKLAKAA